MAEMAWTFTVDTSGDENFGQYKTLGFYPQWAASNKHRDVKKFAIDLEDIALQAVTNFLHCVVGTSFC